MSSYKNIRYKSKRKGGYQNKQQAAAAAGRAARDTILSSRRSYSSPLQSGGFWGPNNRPGGLAPELKTIDTTGGPTVFTTGGVLTLLNGVTDGVAYNTRVGTKIRMKSLLLRLSTFPVVSGTGDPTTEMVRFMVVYDAQSNAAAPTVANILQTAAWDSPNNLAYRDRFYVLMDKTIDIGANVYAANVLTAGNVKSNHVKCYKKISLETVYNGTGATIASISGGSVYLLAISAFGQDQQYYYNSRIRFIDP